MSTPWSFPLTASMAAGAARVAAGIPEVETARLTLRAPRLSDFPALAEIACSERGVHIGGPMSEEAAWDDFCRMTAVWLLRGHGAWTVTLKEGEVLGFVLIGFEVGDVEPELGFLFRESAEGRGYAAEAARAARDHAFGALGLKSLVSYIDAGNTRSGRLAERLGAVREADLTFPDGSSVQVWRHRPERAA